MLQKFVEGQAVADFCNSCSWLVLHGKVIAEIVSLALLQIGAGGGEKL